MNKKTARNKQIVFFAESKKTVKLKLFSLERDKNKKVFRTKTQKGPRAYFLDILCEILRDTIISILDI